MIDLPFESVIEGITFEGHTKRDRLFPGSNLWIARAKKAEFVNDTLWVTVERQSTS